MYYSFITYARNADMLAIFLFWAPRSISNFWIKEQKFKKKVLVIQIVSILIQKYCCIQNQKMFIWGLYGKWQGMFLPYSLPPKRREVFQVPLYSDGDLIYKKAATKILLIDLYYSHKNSLFVGVTSSRELFISLWFSLVKISESVKE